ncbi:MAG TPA: rhomboid family intramembrane serine protease [Candidatus Scatomorpha merdipullorum]|uniref:Rhomboid family intramembrane serine protease n=1 Tax=Candidatus Scatomorpha merdipullorum TaxID=2840927 RepID=A0A9D1FDI4_9FIRM|nr:rhomboid family intramembrane serine protease [Candidatus Scatomorpha merdipullorum]
MLYIVFGTLAVWLLGAMDRTNLLESYLAFDAAAVLHGQVWRIVTFVLIPESGGIWLLLFLYFYYFIGSTLEREWGSGRFTIYYLMGMLLTVVYGFVTYFVTGRSYLMTANYINLSMFFAFATLFPDNRVLLFYFIPIKIKWLAIVDALYFVYAIFEGLGRGQGMMSFLPLVAILNYFLFCGDTLFRSVAPRSREQRQSTINFKRAARKINYEQKTRGYTRKCAVCGRTDTDYPELEFRYCSRCKGVHCFCQDHINNHVHFSE